MSGHIPQTGEPGTKIAARRVAREVWRALSHAARTRITSHWSEFLRSANWSRILVYVPFGDELDLLPALAGFDPARIYAPCTRANHEMEFRRFDPRADAPVPGYLAVPGPAPDAPPLTLPLGPDDLVVVPALGAGYYDRWRERLAAAQLVGVFPRSVAILDFSGESHDIRFNYIITEDGPCRR